MNRITGKLLSPLEPFQFDQEIEAHDFSPELPDQTDRGFGRPPRRQEIIDDQDTLSRTDRIPVDCQGIRSVLKAVFYFETIGRQLPRLADRDEPGAKPAGQHAAENKSPGLDPHHLIDPVRLIAHGQLVRQLAEGHRIFQQGRNIVEENAGLWKIRHFADEGLIVDRELRR